MSEVATFFRHPEKHSGETYHIEIGSSHVSVYSRKAIPSKLLKQAVDRKETDIGLKDLRSAVNQGGGGVIVTVSDDGGEMNLKVDWVGPKEDCQFVILSPGRGPRFSQDKERLPAASHVIVPVDQDAEDNLRRFIGQLAWLSPDLESLVLNAIRRPSLDSRLNNVEARLFGQSSDEALNAGRFRRTMVAVKRWATSQAYSVAAGLLTLLLVANGLLLWRLYSRLGQPYTVNPAAHTSTSATQRTNDSSKTVTRAKRDAEFVDEARDLFKILHAKRPTDPVLDTLYKEHFREFDDEALTDEQVAGVFRRGNQRFLWGIIKLQALKLEPRPADPTFLTAWDEMTATKTVLRNIGTNRIEADSEGLRLLAAIACRFDYSTPPEPTPGLPETPSAPALVFEVDGDCSTLTATDIEKGLQGLIKFVEQRP